MEIKIPFYNILNMFLTGFVFLGGCILIYPSYASDLISSKIIKSLGASPEILVIVCAFAVAYETGLIINRLGSVVIEWFLTRAKMIPFNDDYVLFNEKKKEYPILHTLSREYALSRTGIALFLTLFVLSIIVQKWYLVIACAAITLVYYLSCRKYSSKIVELMEGKKPAKQRRSLNENDTRSQKKK